VKLKSNFYAPLLFVAVLSLIGLSPGMVKLAESLSEDSFLSITIIQLLVYLIPLAFYCRVRNLNLVNTLKLSYFSAKKIPLLFVIALILLVGSALFRYMGLFWFPSAFLDTPATLHVPLESEEGFFTVLCAVILPAALEEFLFRGILMEEYRAYGSFWAVAITSVMYAMAHLSLENFLYYLFFGAFLGISAVFCDSVVPSITLHALTLFSYYYLRPSALNYLRQAGKSPLLPYLLAAVFLFLFYLMFARMEQFFQNQAYDELLQSRKELLRRELESFEEKSVEPVQRRERFLSSLKEIFLSPTFLASVAIFISLITGIL